MWNRCRFSNNDGRSKIHQPSMRYLDPSNWPGQESVFTTLQSDIRGGVWKVGPSPVTAVPIQPAAIASSMPTRWSRRWKWPRVALFSKAVDRCKLQRLLICRQRGECTWPALALHRTGVGSFDHSCDDEPGQFEVRVHSARESDCAVVYGCAWHTGY